MTYELQPGLLVRLFSATDTWLHRGQPRCCIKLHRANLPIVLSLSLSLWFPMHAAIPAERYFLSYHKVGGGNFLPGHECCSIVDSTGWTFSFSLVRKRNSIVAESSSYYESLDSVALARSMAFIRLLPLWCWFIQRIIRHALTMHFSQLPIHYTS